MQKVSSSARTTQSFVKILSQAVPAFPLEAIHRLNEISLTHAFEYGDVIITEGRPSGGIYLLLSGAVEAAMSLETLGGKKWVELPRVSAPALLGTASCMLGEPAALNFRASTRVEAVFIPQEQFLKIVSEYPEAGLAVSHFLAEELAKTYTHLSALRNGSAAMTPSSLLN